MRWILQSTSQRAVTLCVWEGNRQAWRKVMAAYRRVDDCGLTVCAPESASGPTLGNEYGKPLPFFIEQMTVAMIMVMKSFLRWRFQTWIWRQTDAVVRRV